MLNRNYTLNRNVRVLRLMCKCKQLKAGQIELVDEGFPK